MTQQEKEVKLHELRQKYEQLSKRYDRGHSYAMQFSDAAVEQFEQSRGTKALIDAMMKIDDEYRQI